jgi:NTP pyrophosphatase (non-canonical NTP hydrolase)
MQAFIDTYKWLSTSGVAKPKFEDIRDWLNEEVDELKQGVDNFNKQECLNAVGDAVWILANFAYFYNLSIGELSLELDKINKSNFTKFCKTEEEAIKTVEAYKNGTHPNKLGESIDTYYTFNNDYYIIKRTKDNKVLKSINFKDVNEF